jgi:hypothetical protein
VSHQPECPVAKVSPTAYDYDEIAYYDCTCDALRAAYQRGFREGYNAHARAAQHWQDTHGAYRQHESKCPWCSPGGES